MGDGHAWSLNPGDEYQRYTDFGLELNTPVEIPAGATRPELSYTDHFSAASDTALYVEVTADDGQTWDTVASFSAAENRPDWVLRRVPLDAYVGQTIRVRFRAAQGSAWYRDHWLINDLRIGEREPLPDLGFPFDDDLDSGAGNWEPAGQWTLAAGEAYSGTYAWSLNPNDEYQRYTDFSLELAGQVTIPAGAQLAYYDHFSLASNTTVYVEITADDGLNWGTLASYTAADNEDTWTLREHSLDAHAGETIRLRFRAVQGSAWYRDVWVLDDVRIEDAATAAAPAGAPAVVATGVETPTRAATATTPTSTAMTTTKSPNLMLGDPALLLLAPLGLLAASGRRRKKRWWARPVAVMLLAVAVVGIGVALAPASVSASAVAASSPAAVPESSLLLASAPATRPASAPSLTPPAAPAAQHTPPITTTRVISYTYDPLGRLTSADYSTGESFGYEYDAVGNRVALTTTTSLSGTAVTTYTYNAANRLTAVDNTPYTWDARGNLVSNGTFTYTYNAAGRMVQAKSLAVTVVYTYNANGLRVVQSVDGVERPFIWDWAAGVPEMLSDGEMLYLVGAETLGNWDSTAWAYYLPDAMGSVRQVVDDAGAVARGRGWTPFGMETGAAQAGLGYTGEWWDANVELLYLRARWYSPESSTFSSKDPVKGLVQNPQSMNGWSYVYGNPVNLTDPSGRYPPLPDPPGYGPSSQPVWDVCTTWPQSGPFRDLCDRAYQHGDLDVMESIYRYIATTETPAMPKSAKALRYFLDGTTTPGETLYFSRGWYLRSSVTKGARDDLKKRITDYVDNLRDNCKCHIPPQNPVHEEFGRIDIDPNRFNIPDDRQTVLGAHTLNVDAHLDLHSHCIGWIKYEFYVYEWFDFRKGAGNTFKIPFLGWVVPTAWADFLVDGGEAAEYWTVVRWTDRDLYWNWK